MSPSRQWNRRALAGAIGLAAGMVDATVTVWFPGLFSVIRFALPGALAITVFSSLDRALVAAVAAGIVMDVLQPSFGFTPIRLALVCVAVRFISQQYVTNRSLIGSVALGIVGLLIDRSILVGATWAHGFIGEAFIPEVHAPLWAEAAWVGACMAVLFLLFAAFSKRFLPFFTRRS
ncbi:MAG: hypothetical protein RL141_749 [Candidatus Parcubacteria bacterium]|jgi:hypothetical protein